MARPINFSNPAFSPALTAHLPEKMGGRGISRTKDGKVIAPFTGPDDPRYLRMLRAIEAGKELSLSAPRADMPGYKGRTSEP